MVARRGFHNNRRVQNNRRSKAITLAAQAPSRRSTLFGPPLLLQGENAADYEALRASIYQAIKPIDIIDEILVEDFMVLQWEIMRLRRWKSALLRTCGHKELEQFLEMVIDLYAKDLSEILVETIGEDQRKDFEQLSERWVRDEPGADKEVEELLDSHGLDIDDVRAKKARSLAQNYTRGDRRALQEVKEYLEADNGTIDDRMADALLKIFDHIERIDRLTAVAETRRNTSLHEIDRHRAVLGEAIRRGVQEVEDAKFEEIETSSAKGKSAA